MTTKVRKRDYELDAFVAALGDVPVETDPKIIHRKSRDFFWFSPVLKRQLQDRLADIVVAPRDEADVMHAASAAARHRVPVTIRGGGTGNYGQCVPVQGGVVLDVSALNAIEWQKGALLRVGAGRKMHLIDAETRKQGYELRMHPSTKRMASIGGFAAGGSAGAGSVTYGGMRELGNITGARVISLEENPRTFELKGDAALKICHGWGTTGIITALEMPLAPAFDWIDFIVSFDDFMTAVRFGYELTLADGVVKKLVTPIAWPVPTYFPSMEQYFPKGRAAVVAMIAEHSIEPFVSLAAAQNGVITYRRPTDESMGARPLYELTWNHTTLHALNVDRDITYLQALYPAFGFMEKVEEIQSLFSPEELLQHFEFTRYAGQPTAYGLALIKYTTDERLNEIMDIHQRHGVFIADPHIWMLEDSAGYKSAGADLMGFKREVDPLGICNPGKMRTYVPLR
ncbi:MAG TPA: FAD-binding oxidoreductase [Xanthobacteraceae bacterium]|nr:FAD-binding oxidoreductase [Xanthobacteraceae bacterium]